MNILVTGGNRGLGLELLKVFAAHGHSTATIIRRQHAESTIKAEIPDCAVFIADITDYEQLVQTDIFTEQHVDVLINNAGSASCGVSVTDTDSAEILNQFTVHCLGAFNVVKVLYPSLCRSNHPVILNISSRLGSISRNAGGEFTGKGFSYGYRIAKSAQNMLTQCLSQDLATSGFNICAVHPGRLKTASAAPDACMTATESAKRIFHLVTQTTIKNGEYYCMESGTMQW